MSEGFVHSVKVPRLYKVTARTVKNVEEEGGSLKQMIYEKKHPNLAGTFALALTTLQHGPQLDELLRKTQLLFNEPRFDPWLARVLITELLWGKKKLASEAKPIQTILTYEKILHDASKTLDSTAIAPSINNKVQKPRYVRVNTLVSSIEQAICTFEDDGWKMLPKSRDYTSYLISLSRLDESWFIQDFHVPELFAFPPGTLFHSHPSYKCGAIVLQDKASCLPAHLLRASPGSTVLDMCAAPGMKTTHLAAIMKNKGKIFAVEKDERRYRVLQKLVESNCAICVTTLNADATSLTPTKCPNVEYILVDPSCSGSGMSDRPAFENAAAKCAPARLKSLQSFQVLILRHALLYFPTVKRVVYSTCSMHPEENEMVIDEILNDIGESYKLLSVKELLGGNWKNFSSMNYACKDNCLYARPEIDFSNGFFVAVFERNFDVPLPEYKRRTLSKDDVVSSDKQENGKGEHEHSETKRWKKNKSNGQSVNELEQTSVDEKMKFEDKDENVSRKKNKKNKVHLTVDESKVPRVKDEVKDEDEDENVSRKKSKKNKVHLTVDESKVPRVKDEVKDEDEDENVSRKKSKKNKVHLTVDESKVPRVKDEVKDEDECVSKKKSKKHKIDQTESESKVLKLKVEVKDEEEIIAKKKSKKNQVDDQTRTESKVSRVKDEIKGEDENVLKKKSKKNELNVTTESEPSAIMTDVDIEPRKKKRKSTELKIGDIDELVKTESAINGDEASVEKKKKKKRSVSVVVTQEVDLTTEDSDHEIKITKTKKMKRENGDISVEFLENPESLADEKVRKKKSKHMELEKMEEVASEASNRKNKKKKTIISIDIS